jgi:hypothetical protein
LTLVTIKLDDDAGGGAKAHVTVDEVGSADSWGTSKSDALRRAARWAEEHLGEATALEGDELSA